MSESNQETNTFEGVTEIALAGFQVFEDLVRIPLRRLTLLFGPNSAGKSAIEDAALILRDMLPNFGMLPPIEPTFDTFPRDRFSRLARHWRRIQEEPLKYAERMSIYLTMNVRYPVQQYLMSRLDVVTEQHDQKWPIYKIELRITFRGTPGEDDDGTLQVERDIEILIDGESALILDEFKRIGINFEHPVLRSITLTKDLFAVAQQYPNIIPTGKGWIYILGENIRVNEEKKLDQDYFRWSAASLNEDIEYQEKYSPEALKAIHEFSKLYDNLTEIVFTYIGQDLSVSFVPASRKIPHEHELVSGGLGEFGIETRGAAEYQHLCRSFASRLYSQNDAFSDDRALSDNVNRMLTDYLFMERGYYLDMDYRVILDPAEFQGLCEGEGPRNLLPGSYSLLIRLFLVDAQGRRFSFDEVGSGLGYILPVLCEICGARFQRQVIVQQPELHLHPALQAALGDVLIDSTEGSIQQLIVETHSEHILLRILKRIRQAHGGRTLDPNLRIEAHEISVVYFDPKPDGTTLVKQLRLSPDGEFLDRWPRGFFSERDQELFDE